MATVVIDDDEPVCWAADYPTEFSISLEDGGVKGTRDFLFQIKEIGRAHV